ncbi:MAG TPA: DUF5312 family protein [Rectinemataceae bacterium]|nr:DUF5312 family protein [Rectinemataceae bacterium]
MTLLALVKSLLSRVLSRNPEEAARKAELRKVYASLSGQEGDWYRPRQNLVLPGFPAVLLEFARLLKPLSDLMKATVANPDQRIAQHFRDFLIECRLSQAGLELRKSLLYEGMTDRLGNSLDPESELERMSGDFRTLLAELESLGPRRIDEELDAVASFVDLSRFDFERLLALFDPGVSIDNPRHRSNFSPVEGELVLPDLLDLHFVLEHFVFETHLRENLLRLMERRMAGVDDTKRKHVAKLVSKIDQMLVDSLDPARLIALARAIKGDPRYVPVVPLRHEEHFAEYKQRLVTQFDKDRDRVSRERRETAMGSDIAALFGSMEIVAIEGYDEEMDSYLRRETSTGFLWVKPLRVLRTFILGVFEPIVRDSLKRILVEGYFDNKAFQNNAANLLYQCEKSASHIADFEKNVAGTGRSSAMALRRYVDEMKRGKDLSPFISRLVDGINGIARDLARDEAKNFAMLAESVVDIVADSKRPSPELVTNIRTLGGARNREILGLLTQGRDRLVIFVRIMRGFGAVYPGIAPSIVGEANDGDPRPAPLASATSRGDLASEGRKP